MTQLLRKVDDALRLSESPYYGRPRDLLPEPPIEQLPSEVVMRAFGQTLFQHLLTGEILECYRISRATATRQDKGLRIRLRVLEPELTGVPWEFLYDPGLEEYVAMSRLTPLVRDLELVQSRDPLLVDAPLRILGLVAAPLGLPALDVAREQQFVNDGIRQLRQAQVTWIEQPTRRALQRALNRDDWHVLHFIGHGSFDKVKNEGFLAFVNDAGEVDRLGATELGRLFEGSFSLRLVVLNACEGARESGQSLFSSTAATLIRRGVPAVLAMQYPVTDVAAIELARVFYEGLADGLPVDTALAEARSAIGHVLPGTLDWGVPVLHLRAPDGRIFVRPETSAARTAIEPELPHLERLPVGITGLGETHGKVPAPPADVSVGRAFVIMPHSIRDGINFEDVYAHYIRPALEGAGCLVSRVEDELKAGALRPDFVQELLLADLVVVDLSTDDPNVWYQLGLRHSLRPRGVIQVQCRRDNLPFDDYVDRALRYHVIDEGLDPNRLDEDRAKLTRLVGATMSAWHEQRVSPVYNLLEVDREPDLKTLRVPEARTFWEADRRRQERIDLARRKGRPGDIIVLAQETSNRAMRSEAYQAAGATLRRQGHFLSALRQYEQALAIEPTNLESRREKGLLLGRLGRADEAKAWLEQVALDHPADSETWAFLGRIAKDAWTTLWQRPGTTPEAMFADARDAVGRLREAIDAYRKSFQSAPSHYYSGLNAATLLRLHEHLTGVPPDPAERDALEGGVRWAIHSALSVKPRDYWVRVSLGDLEVLSADKAPVVTAYGEAVAVADGDWFALDSSRQQLALLRDLGFRSAEVRAALAILEREINVLSSPAPISEPRQVFLFSGHMIDGPDRPEPRFPSDKEEIAARVISQTLDELGAGPHDVALCGGASGGDLLFAEACLVRGLQLEVRIPFDEPTFLRTSVDVANGTWRARFFDVKSNPRTSVLAQPDELGVARHQTVSEAYVRNNLWELYSAACRDLEKVHFIALWDLQSDDGPGGTAHMYELALNAGVRVHVLDVRLL
jgi:tetratricopeptide (TPR) repeat protein